MSSQPKYFREASTLVALSLALWLLAMLVPSAAAQTNFALLKGFTGADGGVPICTLANGQDGALYGTTAGGGISNMGTVFRINKDGLGFRLLKSFVGVDGASPATGLVMSTNGSLFGTTYAGGISNFGTVFTLSKDGGGFAVLHSFTGSSDSRTPEGALIEGSDGALYGTTVFGDSATRGTIFKLNKDGSNYCVLHGFTGSPDGQQPEARLSEGSDGALYGTTAFGGLVSQGGTVFSLNKDGSGYGVLYSFGGTSGDGREPAAGLLEGSDGALYGTTYRGGSGKVGTVFMMNKDGGGYSVLRSFLTTGGDGQNPDTELIEAADGALYGGTYRAGPNPTGTIFKLNKDGNGYAILRSFAATGGDWSTPNALLQASNGVFYGTTQYGGEFGGGCVFALSTSPLPPRIVSLSVSNSSNLIQFATTSAIQYDVQSSTNLSSWFVLATLTSPASGQLGYYDLSPPKPAAFYRLQEH